MSVIAVVAFVVPAGIALAAEHPGAIGNPCMWNGTCPCPISADPIAGNRAEWKSCVMQKYPKLADGSTLVCRLTPVIDPTKPVCAKDQAGFGITKFLTNGLEIPLW